MNIDKQLETIQQEKVIQEIDPVTVGVVGSVLVVSNFILILFQSMAIAKQIKVDPTLTKRLNKILDHPEKYIVHIFKDKSPNAFSMGFGKHIFVTSKLLKMLSSKEIDAVLLHEVYHSKSKHMYQDLAYTYTTWYLAVFVAFSIPIISLPIVAIIFFIMTQLLDIPYRITVGRIHEYNADSYAAKQGYGDYLISAFKKLEGYGKTLAEKSKKQCGTWCQVINKVDRALDEHPSDKKRIENILKVINKLKSASYGKIKDFVTKAWNK